ncbi:hypothetical protein ACNFJ7_10590 [Sphingomonas sp. HT-1]|uniref:hypothetical protein n=1 Tax=unclassified Sphingomonas TaxID=196159 RepID=UPI0002D96BB7|nr:MULTISPECIES: hypothetical protein [unclassified Sphingomonas]KTF70382.1 hypothetical protein ATB93_05055 [Sphingomonas sp. WG]
MRKLLLLPVAAFALAGLSACGGNAQNEAAEANEAMVGDSNTMGEAVADVNAAEDAAFTDAENAYATNATTIGNEIVD